MIPLKTNLNYVVILMLVLVLVRSYINMKDKVNATVYTLFGDVRMCHN